MSVDERLIYLEPDEEITAIIDRLREADARSVRLVVPKGALILQSLISLKLLKREAAVLDREIALVIHDEVGQRLAAAADLTVYRKPKDQAAVHAATAELKTQNSTTPPIGGGSRSGGKLKSEAENDTPPAEDVPEGLAVHHYTEDGERRTENGNDESGDEIRVTDFPESDTSDRSNSSDPSNRGDRPVLPVRRTPRRFIGLVIGILALLILGPLAFLEFAPRATIALTLATEPLETAVSLTATTELTEPDLDNARIPATLAMAEVRVSREAPATGKKPVGNKATAALTLYNYWDANAQTIAAGTGFRAPDGTPFVATAAATIPGATTTLSQGQVVTTPGTTSVVVEAEAAGTDANGKSGTFTIPSLSAARQSKIYGEAANPSAGGTSQEVTIVTQADLDTLTAATREAATAEARTKLTEGLSGRLLDGALEVTMGGEAASAAVDAEAQQLTLTVVATARGLLVADDQLKAATVAVLERAVSSGRMLVLRDNDTLTPVASNLILEPGSVEIRVTVATRTALAIDVAAVAGTLTNLPVPEAEARLRETAGVTAVTIDNRPRWLDRLPRRPSQIQITTVVGTDE